MYLMMKLTRIFIFTIIFCLIIITIKLLTINFLLSTHFVRRIITYTIYNYLNTELTYKKIYFIPFKFRIENLSIPYLGKKHEFQLFQSKIAELRLSPLFFNIEKIMFDDVRFLFILDENHKHIKRLTRENLQLKTENLPEFIFFNDTTILISHNKNEMKFEDLSIELTKNEKGYNFSLQGSINAKGIIDINKKEVIFSITDSKTSTFNF